MAEDFKTEDQAAQELQNEPPQEASTETPVQEAPVEEDKEPEGKKSRKVSRKELEAVQAELEKTKKELAALKDKYLRTRAEYDNFRKRTEREKAAIYGDGTSDTIKGMLPVADNLERALAQKECSVEDLRKGVEMVQTQFMDSLKKLGITEMGAVGEEFDPNLHNAVSHIEDENLEVNVISAVYQKGYMLGDKVVRHAMVQVAN